MRVLIAGLAMISATCALGGEARGSRPVATGSAGTEEKTAAFVPSTVNVRIQDFAVQYVLDVPQRANYPKREGGTRNEAHCRTGHVKGVVTWEFG